MKKLTRTQLAPKCLSNYDHRSDGWEAVTAEEKGEIWLCLDSMQENYCAYCESILKAENKHIEHFRSRKKHGNLTFSWSNIFGSCSNSNRCGHYKVSVQPSHL